MGSANSKTEKNEALSLCKHRRKFIKQAIDSRYKLAAAHVSYIQSLRNIGIAFRRYAEAEVLIESSLSTLITEVDKTPSHSSCPSPTPSHTADVSDSPLHNESPPVATMSYMRARGSSAVTVMVNPSSNNLVHDESIPISIPPPPLPRTSSWDYFDPADDGEGFGFVGHDGVNLSFDDMRGCTQFRGEDAEFCIKGDNGNRANYGSGGNDDNSRPRIEQSASEISGSLASHNGKLAENEAYVVTTGVVGSQDAVDSELKQPDKECQANRLALEKSDSKMGDNTMVDKNLSAEREDPSEFITHRAKDFLSSIKDIEHRFVRASEAGKEVSRMLEANKIRVRFSETKGRSRVSVCVAAIQLLCPKGNGQLVSHEPIQHVTKVITWKRTMSSRSTSSRNPLAGATIEDASDSSGCEFAEEFCMFSGSHSSTLERLYAWERKLYDEVKASESIRKEYDHKCNQLKHQFAKDQSAQIMDKTRAVIKDLHSRIRVAIHSVDSISKRIEKMRDEELQPQLVELVQGFIRMWKAMLECHHAQYITISLAYHSRGSKGTPQGETRKQILDQLQQEVECFGLSFTDWMNSLTSYVEALNGWLQHCILEPQERSRRKSLAFSPRRVLAPPIFCLCREWSSVIKSLPSKELADAIKDLLSDLHHLKEQQAEELQTKQKSLDLENGETESGIAEKSEITPSNLHSMHTSLSRVLDWLTKFSEGSLKMYEDVRQKSEAARNAYMSKPARY